MRTRVVGTVVVIAGILGLVAFLLSRGGGDFDDALQAVSDAIVQRDLDKALELAHRARPLAKTPDQHYVLSVLEGTAYEQLGRAPEAREVYRAVLAVAGDCPGRRLEIYMRIAATYDEQDEAAEIRATFAEALGGNLDPDARHVVLLRFAEACMVEGDCAAAEAAYDELLAAHDVFPSVRLLAQRDVGDAHVEQGKFEEAFGDYLKALLLPSRAAVDSSSICCGIGKALMGLGHHAEARQLLSTCAESEGFVPVLRVDAYSLLEKSFRQEDMTEEAERTAQRALEIDLRAELDEDRVLEVQSAIDSASLLAIGRYFKEAAKDEQARTALDALAEDQNAPDEVREQARALLKEMD
jgi:tetratricopeptide (TPR) repeat protein